MGGGGEVPRGRATEEESCRLTPKRKIFHFLFSWVAAGFFFCSCFLSQSRPRCERCERSITYEIGVTSAEQLRAARQHEEARLLQRLEGAKGKKKSATAELFDVGASLTFSFFLKSVYLKALHTDFHRKGRQQAEPPDPSLSHPPDVQPHQFMRPTELRPWGGGRVQF